MVTLTETQDTDSGQLSLRDHRLRLERERDTLRADIVAVCVDRDRALECILRLEAERDAARAALVAMVQQHLSARLGHIAHEFMSAQEDTIDYLVGIGWLRAGEYERYYWTPAALKARAGTKEGVQ